MSPVNKNDVLLIPARGAADVVKVEWNQSFSSRSANYCPLIVKNKTQGNTEVVFYIADEWYNTGKLDSVAKKVDDVYEFTVDSKCQYGQKNAAGDMRFVVYHDESRGPYQHRFLEATLVSTAGNLTGKIAGLLGCGTSAVAVKNIPRTVVGDYLRTF